jgi:phage terminase large subunit-like protein
MPRTQPPPWAVRTEADRRAIADGYYWDQDQADRVIRFAEAYVSPKYTGSEFQLFPWQERFVRSLYGWRRPDGGRRFTSAVLHVGKKNGKTLLVSLLAVYELYAAGVPSPLVISASTTKKNATQVFEQIKATLNRSGKLSALSKTVDFEKRVKVASKDGEYWAMSADAPNAEGWNISFGIVDEAHAHKNPKLYRALEHGTSGRDNGLIVVISTAGDDFTHFYYAMLLRARRLVAGEDLDPTTYAEVYEPDPDADPDDPATWAAGNPSLDLYPGFTTQRFRLGWEKARQDTGDRLNFLRYRMNLFTRAEDAPWVDLARWDQLRAEVPEDVLKQCPCFLGFDGSATTDPTSLSAVWLLPERRYFARSWAWVADEGVRLREKTNLPKYRQFVAEGNMTITPGNLIYKEPIRRHVLALRDAGHQVKALVMDVNGAHIFGTELQGDGFTVHTMPQSFRYFNEPTREFQAAVAAGTIAHDGNGWLRYCIHSVRVDTDKQNNVRPVKAKSADHIDGAVSTLMAFRFAMEAAAAPPPAPSVYEREGLEFWD